jgi:hypothetical protein
LQIDASLLEEWEKLEHPDAAAPAAQQAEADATGPADITKDRRAFRILVRNACFRLVRALAAGDYARALAMLGELAPEPESDSEGAGPAPAASPWTRPALESLVAPYWAEHTQLLVDAPARSAARCQLDESAADHWQVRQVLSDPEENQDWALRLRVDLGASRQQGTLVLELQALENE